MRADLTKTASDAAAAIKDMIDSNFDLNMLPDEAFVADVLKLLGLRDNQIQMAQVASKLVLKGFLIPKEYPKMLYQLRDNGTVRRHKVHDADEEKALEGTWYATPEEAQAGSANPKAKAKAKG